VFKKLFGKKNDGFYMQVEDDAPTAKVSAKAKPAATKVAAPTAVAATATPLTPAEKKIADAEKAVAKTAAKAEKKSAKKAVDEKKVAAVAPAPALPPITNFATDYLIKPSSDSNRRRPGANMSKFLELAREAKIPVNVKK
jgi:hypothetical protein